MARSGHAKFHELLPAAVALGLAFASAALAQETPAPAPETSREPTRQPGGDVAPPTANSTANASQALAANPVTRPLATAPEDLETRLNRMESTLIRLDKSGSSNGAVGSLVVGAVYVGLGCVFAFAPADKPTQPMDSVSRAAGITGMMMIGIPTFTWGVYRLSRGSSSKSTLEVFRRERRAGSISELELGRYEGILHENAASAHAGRIAGGVSGIGSIIAGGVLVALGATKLNDGGRVLLYAEGGLSALFGTWATISNFSSESTMEREWRTYVRSLPKQSRGHLAFAPYVTPTGVGLALSATF